MTETVMDDFQLFPEIERLEIPIFGKMFNKDSLTSSSTKHKHKRDKDITSADSLDFELFSIIDKCKEDNWGNENEKSISPKTIFNAKCVLDIIKSLSLPIEIVPNSIGMISIILENSQYSSILSIDKDENIYFSQLDTITFATKTFNTKISKLGDTIEDIYSSFI